MSYNPQIHHRRSIRLKGYDYSKAGAYFITICCENRKCRFGTIENNQMILNEYGNFAYNQWSKLPERFLNFELDVFQIMPNHMHGIIMLNDQIVGERFTRSPVKPEIDANKQQSQLGQSNGLSIPYILDGIVANDKGERVNRPPTDYRLPTIGDIVGAYKSLVANECLEIFKLKNEKMGKLWQRNYYEHIIRDEQSYQTISNYIINNPAKWNNDKFFNI
jgi:putative transposase